jgi:hypothetical protein
MNNAVKCQATALTMNTAAGLVDAAVKTNKYYPENYPISAYGYIPSTAAAPKVFGDYGAKQIAQMVQRGELNPNVRNHVKSVVTLVVDADNTKSPKNNNNVEDLRAAGVKH